MKRIITITLIIAALFTALPTATVKAQTGVGTWKAYMSYHTVTKVVKHAGMFLCAASGDLYTTTPPTTASAPTTRPTC